MQCISLAANDTNLKTYLFQVLMHMCNLKLNAITLLQRNWSKCSNWYKWKWRLFFNFMPHVYNYTFKAPLEGLVYEKWLILPAGHTNINWGKCLMNKIFNTNHNSPMLICNLCIQKNVWIHGSRITLYVLRVLWKHLLM